MLQSLGLMMPPRGCTSCIPGFGFKITTGKRWSSSCNEMLPLPCGRFPCCPRSCETFPTSGPPLSWGTGRFPGKQPFPANPSASTTHKRKRSGSREDVWNVAGQYAPSTTAHILVANHFLGLSSSNATTLPILQQRVPYFYFVLLLVAGDRPFFVHGCRVSFHIGKYSPLLSGFRDSHTRDCILSSSSFDDIQPGWDFPYSNYPVAKVSKNQEFEILLLCKIKHSSCNR